MSAILLGAAAPTDGTLTKLIYGMAELERAALAEKDSSEAIMQCVRNIVAQTSLRCVAREIDIDPGNLLRVLNEERKPTTAVVMKIQNLLRR